MKNKSLYLIILFFVFTYGVVVGHYKVFPYNIISYNKKSFHKIFNKIYDKIYYEDFSDNKKCILDINNKIESNEDFDYSFFIAGHVYGAPGGNNLGIYPKFYKNLLTKKNVFDFGIFAGDVTRKGDKKSWDYLDNQINDLGFEIYIAPGNHDVGDTKDNTKRTNFKKRYGNLYKSIKYRNDLFIILDPYENQWSIKNQQLNFLKKELQQNYQIVHNIFIISHPVIYKNNKFRVKNNSNSGAGEYINFWDEIYPLTQKYNNNYYIVAGDIGAGGNGFELFCKEFEKTIFLATGMGGGINDNYLIFKKMGKRIKFFLEVF